MGTEGGKVYWKAVALPFHYEAQLINTLSEQRPDYFPRILNADEIENATTDSRGMLMAEPEVEAASARGEWAYLSTWAACAEPEAHLDAFATWKPLRHLLIAERQIEITTAFQTLRADANRGVRTPCGDALRRVQWWLRSAARQLIAAHKGFA